jgi:hypothetical protein
MKQKQAREEFVRTILSYYAHPNDERLERGMEMIRNSYRTGALEPHERVGIKAALQACDEFEALAARYGT